MIYKNLLIHNDIFEKLSNISSNKKVQNSYIFHGQKGIGKEAHAIEFFASLNCNNKNTDCNSCSSCNKTKVLQHELLNIILPLPKNKSITKNDSALKTLDNKQLDELTKEFQAKGQNPYHQIKLRNANTILINSINDIKKSISLSIPKNKYKLHLILEAEKLCYPRQEAGNALLKILEEPPENNFFILITSDISKILDTIISRSSIINFNNIEFQKHYDFLIQNNINENIAKITPKISFGDINYSLQLSNNFKETTEILEELIESLINSNLVKWEKKFNSIKDKNNIIEIINLLNILLTDACKYKNNEKNIYFNNLEKHLSLLSKSQSLNIEKFNQIINKTINNINLNGYIPLMTSGLYIDLNKQLNTNF